MTRAAVEHDFFALEGADNSQRCSIRGIQSAISRMNLDLVRSVMENPRPPPLWTVAGPNWILTPSDPVLARSPSTMVNEGPLRTAPLTICYNGTVTVFHVGPAEAEAITKAAADWNASAKEEGILDKLTEDLPMQRFFEKRKERCCFTVKGLTEKFKEKDTSYSGSATFTYEMFMLTVLPFLIA